MVGVFKFFVILCMCILHQTDSQIQDSSPCPKLFAYESKYNEPGKWYGIITLLSETDLKEIWIRLIFDKPSLQLGNWFGQVSTVDYQEYLIQNTSFELKAHTSHPVRFYIKYNPLETPPRLLVVRINSKTVCPDETEPASATFEHVSANAPPAVPSTTKSQLQFRPSLSTTESGDDVEYYPEGFHQFVRRTTKPTPTTNSPDLNEICGTVTAQAKELIAHGNKVDEGQFPWHVALYQTKVTDLVFTCGGTLISKIHVISAAHCTTKRKSKVPLNPDTLVIYLGKYYLKHYTNPNVQIRPADTITPHPDYNPKVFTNDLAVIKLTQAVEFSDFVRPICLWQDSTDISAVVDKQGTVVGWGFDENGKLTEQLMQTKMPVVPLGTCIYTYPEFYAKFTSPTTFCAGFLNGTSVCNGDSGGGMVFPRYTKSKIPRWQLRGLVSLSVSLENELKCDTSFYVIFTDLAKYLDWIKQTML